MRVVFMGTPSFAVPCLASLLEHPGVTVCGVFTKPDQKQGRGQNVQAPPVKTLAEQHGIPVFQPSSLKEGASLVEGGALDLLTTLAPEVVIVVAYGKILPLSMLTLPPYGCINIHASLLPAYRGAGPIQWSILNGETETGITSMYMAEGMDTGDMILRRAIPIGGNETAVSLGERLSLLGAETLIETIDLLLGLGAGETRLPAEAQDDAEASYAPMLTKAMCEVDFRKPAQMVHNQIRGLSAWPCATTTLLGKRLKLYGSEVVPREADTTPHGSAPGTLLCPKTLTVQCGEDTAIRLCEVQYEGSKRMSGQAFANGRVLVPGTILGG